MSTNNEEKKSSAKKFVALGLGVGLTAGTLGGLIALPSLSGAQTSTDSTATAPAERPDPGARFDEALKPLVDNGTITQEQADAVKQALKDSRGKGGPRGMQLDAVAQALGLSADELHTKLEGGSTIAQVAQEQNVDVQVVIDAMVAGMNNRTDEALANGKIDQTKADQLKANATQRATDMVNGVRPERPAGARGGRGPHADSNSTTPGA